MAALHQASAALDNLQSYVKASHTPYSDLPENEQRASDSAKKEVCGLNIESYRSFH